MFSDVTWYPLSDLKSVMNDIAQHIASHAGKQIDDTRVNGKQWTEQLTAIVNCGFNRNANSECKLAAPQPLQSSVTSAFASHPKTLMDTIDMAIVNFVV